MGLLYSDNTWTWTRIQDTFQACEDIFKEEFPKLKLYESQIEMISTEQMLDAYSSIGMPVMYKHWSFGKHFIINQRNYLSGRQGLAYELVVNTAPTIAYLMEDNTMTMQNLVIAHACQGHGSFFANNNLFLEWTDAHTIVDYLSFARDYISSCEQRYGTQAVELTLDSCHALQSHGVDRYKRPRKLSVAEETQRQHEREEYNERTFNKLWSSVIPNKKNTNFSYERFPKEPQENLLYFIEKNSPSLATWQRELVRIVRKVAQYFYPQRQTKVMNEGWASFTHYNIMNKLWERGLINEGTYLEFIQSHTGVVFQPAYNSPYYSGINPYALGFDMFNDIKRICTEPTNEDKEWFPDLVNTDWREAVQYAMINFRDESFISQYLSPKMIRDWHMFLMKDDSADPIYLIDKIHNSGGYKKIRSELSNQHNMSMNEPEIVVWDANINGDRTLHLRHFQYNGIPLDKHTQQVAQHIRRLWGYRVSLVSQDASTGRELDRYECT